MTNFKIIKNMSINELAKFIYKIKDTDGFKTLNKETIRDDEESIEIWLKSKTKISNREKDVIFALAENNLNVSEVARKLFLNRNTVLYHIGEIKRISGFNPLDFYDLQKLIERVKADDEL